MNIGYVRVSKREQREGLQVDALKVAGCEKRQASSNESRSPE